MEVKKAAEAKLLPAEASYVLRRVEDGFRIVAQIDHQDLVGTLRGL